MNTSDENLLLVELGNLLEKQIEIAHRGGATGLRHLAGQSETLVKKIAEAGLLEKPEHKAQRERLDKLYRDLQTLISTQKDDVGEQLKSIGRGKKTLAAYRNNA
jgi:hypothetical protein